MSGTAVTLLGRLTVECDGRDVTSSLGGRVGLAFAYLLLHRHRAVRRDELAAALWETRAPENPDAALRVVLSRMRRALGDHALVGRAEISLALPEPLDLDLQRLDDAVRRAEASRELLDAQSAAELARAELLPGLDASWLREERERLVDLRERALTALSEAALRGGTAGASTARTAARELVGLAPFGETGQRLLIEALASRGDQAEALRAYGEFRVALRDELGVAPSPVLQALHAKLLAGWEDTGSETRAQLTLPAEASAARRPALVGREAELAQLTALARGASEGGFAHAWLLGEAGIGKSRLASALASVAHAEGMDVAWGRCNEEGLAAYEPFAEVMRQLATALRDEELARISTAAGPAFLTIAPELARRVAAVPVTAASEDLRLRRHQILESACQFIALSAQSRPLVLVLEDLHWADPSTVLMLEHLTGRSRPAGLLVLCTLRPAEAQGEAPIAPTLAAAELRGGPEAIRVEGLDVEGTRRIVGELAPESDRSAEIHARSEGNPLFVVECVRSLAFGPEALPYRIGEVIEERLRRLAPDTARLLGAAAVVGRQFDLAVAARAAAMPQAPAGDASEQALAARLLEQLPDGRLSFAHALIREVCYLQQPAARRAELHAAVADALQELLEGAPAGQQLAGVAGHLEAAAVDSDSARAAFAALRAAAERATASAAFEDAAARLERARALFTLACVPAAERCDVLLALADARRSSERIVESREAARAASQLAHSIGDGRRLAAAALAFVGSQLMFKAGRLDVEDVELLEQARAALPAGETVMLARLLSRLCSAVYYSERLPEVEPMSLEAAALARASGEEDALGWALFSRIWATLGPEKVDDAEAVVAEITAIASRTQQVALACEATVTRCQMLLRRGRPDELEEMLRGARKPMLATGVASYRWFVDAMDAMLAVVRGENAEAAIRTAVVNGSAVDPQDAQRFGAIPLERLRLDQGRAEELIAPLRAVVERNPGLPVWRASLLRALALSGEAEEARELLSDMRGGLAEWRRDVNWLWGMAAIAEACAELEDGECARELHGLLAAVPDQSVVTGPALAFHGPLRRYTARLEAMLGRHEQADAAFAVATEQLDAVGARPLAAWTRLAHARALVDAGRPKQAAAAAAAAMDAAKRLDLEALVRAARSVVEGTGPSNARRTR